MGPSLTRRSASIVWEYASGGPRLPRNRLRGPRRMLRGTRRAHSRYPAHRRGANPGLNGTTKEPSNLPVLNEEAFEDKPLRSYRIPPPKPGTVPEQTVIGEMTSHRVRQGETLLDVARYYDLGIN